jgi:Na+-translocating ferredoxin:NAD+ oxidoreductase RNF subunit RnfB
MAYIITNTCTKDELCIDACPVDCIHPRQANRTSPRRTSCMLIRKRASTAARASRFAPPRPFTWTAICRRSSPHSLT